MLASSYDSESTREDTNFPGCVVSSMLLKKILIVVTTWTCIHQSSFIIWSIKRFISIITIIKFILQLNFQINPCNIHRLAESKTIF